MIAQPVYLTHHLKPIGGRIKLRPEDFLVEEQPLYQPSGHGEHIYLFVQKRDLSTLHAARILARHFGVHLSAVGYAGLKDKRAITTQTFSIHTPGKTPEDFPMLTHDRLQILWADLHTNKLRRGHLAGNRFSIRIRGVDMSAPLVAHKALRELERVGVPNRIGEQRFGYMRRNHLVGLAIVKADAQAAIDALLAPRGPHENFPDFQHEGRELYRAGRYADAIAAFSPKSRTERRVLAALARGQGAARALAAIDRPELEFFLTAMQSAVFNAILDQRLREGTLGRLAPGDVACKLDNRAMFAVTDADLVGPDLQSRLDRLEISPTGPMWGPKMMRAAGNTDARELEALAALGLTPAALDAFDARRPNRLIGDRRPLRVPLTYPDVEGGIDEHGPYVRVAFDLPRGSFATEVLREIMKPELAGTPIEEESPDDEDEAENPADPALHQHDTKQQ